MSNSAEQDETDLLFCCQGLGTITEHFTKNNVKETRFNVGKKVLESIKGIEYLLRRDNPDIQDMYIRLGHWQTVKTHLLPVIVKCRTDRTIIYHCIRLLVRVTLPPPPLVENHALRISHLQKYKAWMCEGDAMAVCMYWLGMILEKSNK